MADSVGSVSVDVVPDARGWSEKLRAQLRDVTVNVPVDADTAKAKAKLDALDASSADVTVNVDDAAATTKLTLIQGQVDKLDGRTANVTVKTDKSSVGGAVSALEKFSGSLGALPALAVTAGAAMIPLGAAIGGVALALGAPLAIAGGGLGLFAVLGGLAVKGTEKQIKDIDKLRTKLGGLDKGTQEYADTQKQLAAATAALSPAQKKLSDSQDHLKGAFEKLTTGKAGDALLGPIAQGMDLLAGILPKLTPLITAVSGALTDMLDDLAKATSGPGFGRFIGQISKMVGPDIEAFGHIIGDVAKGVGDLLLQFGSSDLSGGLLKQLEGLASSFSGWASSKKGRDQVQSFIAYVKDVGPQVASTIGKIADAFVQIATALAPLAPGVFKALGGAADAISAIPLPVLTTLATALVGLTGFSKLGGFKLLGALGKGAPGTGITGAVKGAFGAGVQKVFVVNMPPGGGIPGEPGMPGSKGLSTVGKLGWFGLAATGTEEIVRGVGKGLEKEMGPTLGGAFTKTFRALIPGAPDPHIMDMQFQELNAVMTGGFGGLKDLLLSTPGQPTTPKQPSGLLPSKPKGPINLAAPAAGPLRGGSLFPAVDMHRTWAAIDATTTKADGLRQSAANATHQIDQIGPQAVQSSNQAIGGFRRAQGALDAIHDKRIQIIVDTGSLISRMQAINNMVIHDKTFTITQINRVVEQNVGPGGGAHRLPTTIGNATGGWIHGPGSGTSDSIPARLSNGEFVVSAAAAAANRDWLNQINNSRRAPGYAMGGPVRAASSGPVHVTVVGHVDEDGYITGTSQDVYAANNDFDRAHG